MSNFSVPDILSFTRLSRGVNDLKARADTTRTEAVTGRYEDVTKHLRGDVGSAHLLKKAVDDVKAYQQSLSLAEGRAQATQFALGTLTQESSRIATEGLSAFSRGDEGTLRTIASDSRAAISSVFASLNTTFGGRTLFGGDVTNSSPLAAPEQLIADVEAIIAGATDAADVEAQLDTYFNDPAGGFETTIYQGGAGDAPEVEIAPGIRVGVSTKANDQTIKDLLRGLVSMATFQSATFAGADAIVENGAKKTLGAESPMADLRASIGVNESRIGSAKSGYEVEESLLTSLYNNKTARDPYEAASELQLLESEIEKSFLLTARLSRLSLSNFIR
ncbi:MAG: hypothetical protein DHS20C05_01380 [Hyphococcus sp.]|nr:MAG: hypothetical protein DHS20C05_01380 [Marinicaulis sp.]